MPSHLVLKPRPPCLCCALLSCALLASAFLPPRSTSPDGPGSASAPTGPLLPGGRPGRLALAAVVTPVRCHAGPLWVNCKPPHTPDPSRGLVPSAVCPSSWQPRPRPASAALGSSVPRLCVGLHRREAGQVRPWLHGVNDTGRRGVLASGPGLGIRPPRGLRWGLVAWAACGLGAVGVRHGGPPSSLSRCVLACSCLRSPVPGRLQTPRQQPDPAPETRGEARAAAGPDLPEAQGGEVEVGGPGRLRVACVSVGGAEMWWPPAFRRCESGPAGGEPLRSRLSLDRACPILKGAVPFGFFWPCHLPVRAAVAQWPRGKVGLALHAACGLRARCGAAHGLCGQLPVGSQVRVGSSSQRHPAYPSSLL